jgi:hypothetical protein
MQLYPLRHLRRTAKYLLISSVLLYAVDWSVFEVRLVLGAGLGTVPVEQYLKTALKGGKAEYDYLGTADESCSRTVFPQHAASQWNPPCWWLERHRQHWR